ncbi:putative quinol monooxygenase [Nocardia farcinica]|uniref:putative quinol monooxygenase n=1 Tax=Nocardia farcinica TaxID=37329 RepID=UPI00245513BC|nr:putative quinol monooxygenase [Nocardia farcinica]
MSNPIVVVATMLAKPGEEDTVEKTLSGAAVSVHAEQGCLLYALHRKSGTPGEFVMIEKWASREDLDAHLRGAVMREVGVALRSALAAPPEVKLLDALPAGDSNLGTL